MLRFPAAVRSEPDRRGALMRQAPSGCITEGRASEAPYFAVIERRALPKDMRSCSVRGHSEAGSTRLRHYGPASDAPRFRGAREAGSARLHHGAIALERACLTSLNRRSREP